MLTSCSVCWTVPGVLIFDHRLQGLLLNPVFWSLSCSRHLYFFLLVGKYTIYDEVFLILKPFLSHGLFIKSAREVTTQTACVHNLLGPQCPDFNTVCRVFLSGNSLGTLVHRPGSFLLNRKFLCFFPSFLGSLHFKWPFLTQVFIKEGSLSWAQLVFTNLEHSLPHSRWALARHIVLISFCSSDTLDLGHVKLVRY